jgi:hypothetical protein
MRANARAAARSRAERAGGRNGPAYGHWLELAHAGIKTGNLAAYDKEIGSI